MLDFSCPGMRRVLISDDVLAHLDRSRQCGRRTSESGGQLFARFDSDAISIVRATGPRKRGGRRTRFSFIPSRQVDAKEITELFAEGLHFVGDWHTHPQPYAAPSHCDLASMTECFQKSRHELDAFVMIIVGTAQIPDGLWIGMHNSHGNVELWHGNLERGEIEPIRPRCSASKSSCRRLHPD